MRFIHIADVHLDTPFARHAPGLRSRLRDASREAFRRAVSLGIAQSVDAFVIAGDLFDGDTLELSTERFIAEEFGRLDAAGIQVVYATGNHDPGDGSVRTGRIDWPETVTVVDGPSPTTVDVRRQGEGRVGRITAVGHAHARVSDDLSAVFPRPEHPDGVPEVAVLHTQVVGSAGGEAHDRYAPSELTNLIASGYDYWALGHVHRRQSLATSPRICYPGTPQGLSIREPGGRGVLLVDLTDRDRSTVRFVEQAPVRWEAIEIVDPIDAANLGSLVRMVESEWRARRAEDVGIPGCEFIVRVQLVGQTPLAAELLRADGIQTLEADLRSALGALDVEVRTRGLVPPVAWEDHRDRPDVLGEALRLVEAVRNDPGALPIPTGELAALHRTGDAAALAEYLGELLEGAESEIAARLLSDPEGA